MRLSHCTPREHLGDDSSPAGYAKALAKSCLGSGYLLATAVVGVNLRGARRVLHPDVLLYESCAFLLGSVMFMLERLGVEDDEDLEEEEEAGPWQRTRTAALIAGMMFESVAGFKDGYSRLLMRTSKYHLFRGPPFDSEVWLASFCDTLLRSRGRRDPVGAMPYTRDDDLISKTAAGRRALAESGAANIAAAFAGVGASMAQLDALF